MPVRQRTPRSELGTMLRGRFARNVRLFRRQRGMTQDELACAAGIGRAFVSQIERGRFSVTLETVAVLSAALGIPPTSLIQSNDQA